MKLHSYWRLTHAVAMLFVTLTTVGCQSVAGRHGSTTSLMQTVPGEMARERHAHVIAASDMFADVLSGQKVSLDDIAFANRLTDNIAASNLSNGESAEIVVQRLAQTHVIARGPYRLVQADTWSGRLEYRSSYNGAHLIVTVRKPESHEREAGHAFIVTDLFGQASLYSLTENKIVPPVNVSRSLKQDSAPLLQITPLAGNNDHDRLDYLDTLPMIERDRADIMAIRTLLMMRMGQDNEASQLVQHGIVRFPSNPIYFTLANLLFERANSKYSSTSGTLSQIMKERFSSAQIRKSRKQVLLFLNQATT